MKRNELSSDWLQKVDDSEKYRVKEIGIAGGVTKRKMI